MDEIETPVRGGPRELHFALALYFMLGLVIVILAAIPEVSGWGEALVLLGLSAVVTLSVLPDISLFRLRRRVNRVLLAFILLQILSGILVGSHVVAKISRYRSDLWAPADLSVPEQLDEIFKMAIGVSEVDNLLPIVVWAIAFHGIFISLMTGLSHWTMLPAMFTVVLGFLWKGEQGTGFLGYALVFVTVVSIGLEGVLRGYLRARRGGLPPSIFRQKVREIMLLSLIVMVAAPLMPDLRKLTPIERIWNLTEQGPSGATRGTLRFSTVFRFGGDLAPDFSPAFTVEASSPHYWRAIVFVNYTGREFLAEAGEAHNPGETIPTSYSVPTEPKSLTQEFTLLSNFPGVILNAFEPSAVFGVDSLQITESRSLFTKGSQGPGTTYGVISRIVMPDPDVLRTLTGSEGFERYTQIPESLPDRVHDLATELTEGLDNSFDRAVAIAQYLKNMRYDLSARQIPSGRDAIDYFLFDMKAGYCQHFAGAMAVLCRSLGIPARVVTGFGSGIYDGFTGRSKAYSVLQANFHAWVEVGFPGFGWVAFDPTPGGVGGPEVADAAEASTILGGILHYYGEIQRRPTETFVTGVPEYVSEELAFVIQGRVIEGGPEGTAVTGVEMNVSMDVRGLDISPGNLTPTDTVPITMFAPRTRSDGSFSALCMLPEGVEEVTSEAKVRVTCLGNEFHESSYANLTLAVLRRSFLTLAVLGDNKSIAAAYLRSSSGPVEGQPLRLFLDGNEIGVRVTNASGMATILMDVAHGRHAISARFEGAGSLGPSFASFNFEVPRGGPPPVENPSSGWMYLLAALITVAAVSFLTLLRRRAAERRPKSMTHLYHRMLDVLGRGGIRRKPNMTPFEFAAYAESRGAPRGEVRELTRYFVEEAYGGRPWKEGELDLARVVLRDLGNSLGGSELRRLRRRTASALSRIL